MSEMTAAPRPRLALAAPDAFKGTATAAEVAAAMVTGATEAGWACDPCPLSDGGEGFAEVLAAADVRVDDAGAGRWVQTTVTGPLGLPVVARWYQRGDRAVIESAAASGLPLAGGAEGNDPLSATTRGTGELIAAAVAAGARRVLVGVGGSATTDGGLGALQAIDEAGGLDGAEVVVACDVSVPFVEAARQFGPQKGASPDQVALLRRRLEDLALRYRERSGRDLRTLPGSGAAGGLGGGLVVVGARLVPGFEVVAEAVGLDERVTGADLVLTGEGRLDASSWVGKVVGGVADRARRARRPVLVVAGTVGPGAEASDLGVVVLSERFGAASALADPAGCVAAAVAEELGRRP
jgi:glycerate 2-kinase